MAPTAVPSKRRDALDSILRKLGQANPGLGEQVEPTEFLRSVASRRFAVRIAIDVGPPATLYRLVADNFPTVSSKRQKVSRYRTIVFAEAVVTGRIIKSWVEQNRGVAGGLHFEIPELAGWATCERHPSLTRHAAASAPWPVLRFLWSTNSAPVAKAQRGWLVAPGLPTFSSLDDALSFHLYPGEDLGTNSLPNEMVIMRLADTRCWIHRMHFAATHVKVTLKGSDVFGASIELVGPHRRRVVAGKSGRVNVPMAASVEDWQQLTVTRDHSWLDIRFLGRAFKYEARPDTTFEQPDWSTTLALLATQGESQTVEYKRQLPLTDGERTKLTKTVIAMANTDGGYLIYGVDEEKSAGPRVVGVDAPPTVSDDLTRIIRATVVPYPGTEVVKAEVDGRQLVAVVVPKHRKRFFALAGSPPRFYVRRNANNFEASLDDIRGLAEALGDQQRSAVGSPWRLPG